MPPPHPALVSERQQASPGSQMNRSPFGRRQLVLVVLRHSPVLSQQTNPSPHPQKRQCREHVPFPHGASLQQGLSLWQLSPLPWQMQVSEDGWQ